MKRRHARLQARGGCTTFVFLVLLIIVWIGREDPAGLSVPLDSDYADPGGSDARGPRRPMPGDLNEEFVVLDEAQKQDSQGTAFAVDADGAWMTAEHVSAGCARLALIQNDDFGPVGRALNSRVSDVAMLLNAPPAAAALPLGAELPSAGDAGYHMGFPAGEPGLVTSRYLGTATARHGPGGRGETVLAWAETGRQGISGEPLGGISGGPTFLADGRIVGVNSASSERRGRVLTTAPFDNLTLVKASGAVDDLAQVTPIASSAAALARFRALRNDGLIRLVYCEV